MTVSVMLITHDDIGEAMLRTVRFTLGELPLPTTVVPIDVNTDPEHLLPRLSQAAQQLEAGQGLLILTDLYGATPSNIATLLGDEQRVRVVSGLNLPMLFRIMNYAQSDVNELALKAVTGGKDGVVAWESNHDAN
jgi:mannose PTS system EIIA component